ncbi:MAG TPA: energy transducer TonB [Candidatus Acidoferrum sp.]|nr:energy transducer TonB [Candidatus Acidoferrum sp.]
MDRGKLGPIRRKLGPIREVNTGKNVEFGSLSQCIMDADSEVLSRARRLKRKAYAASIVLQAVCVAALLIWPLIAAPNVLPRPYLVTPVPPYAGSGNAEKPHVHRLVSHASRPLFIRSIVFSTAITHSRIFEPSTDSTPDTGAPVDLGVGVEVGPAGFGIPNSIGTGVPIQPPRPVPPAQTVVYRSEGVMAGQLVHQVQPQYPEIARSIHLSGTVRLQAVVGIDGTVRDVEVLDGNPLLTRAAVDAVRQWRYRPTLLNGLPVEVETYITVNFVLSE